MSENVKPILDASPTGESNSAGFQEVALLDHDYLHSSPSVDENDNTNTSIGQRNGKEEELRKNVGICFVCHERNLSSLADCKSCQNVQLYFSKLCQDKLNGNVVNDEDSINEKVPFPGPGIVRRNNIYGNYVVASRVIEEGELIIFEKPMSIGPYSPSDILPLCLSCCQDIGLSSRCSKCKWPVCGTECEQVKFLHHFRVLFLITHYSAG